MSSLSPTTERQNSTASPFTAAPIMVLEALGQSSRNEVDLESKPRLQENINNNRPPKRIKHVHLHKSTDNIKGIIGKKSESESEQEDSPSFADNGLYASLPLPNDHDTAIREYTATEKYRKSIYVEAFNLALDTVLKDELHLFSDSEQEIFAKYRSLEYEPQFLYDQSYQLLSLYYTNAATLSDIFVCFSAKHRLGFV